MIHDEMTPNNALRGIREVVGCSQRDFALRLEASASAIQLIENGRRKINRPLALKVSAYTGCDPEALIDGKALELGGRDYTERSFVYWRELVHVSPEEVRDVAQHFAKASAFLIQAAASDASGGDQNQHRFREVTTLLSQALDDVRRRFGLTDALLHKMASETTTGDWEDVTLGVARVQFGKAKSWSEIDDPKKSGSTIIQVRSTNYPLWTPFFGSSLRGEPANYAMALVKSKKKIEIRVPWKEGVSVLWFTELSTPGGKSYEVCPEEPKPQAS